MYHPQAQPSTSTSTFNPVLNTYPYPPNQSSSTSASTMHPFPLDSSEDPVPPEDDAEAEAVFRDMSWEEILDDLNVRFLLNLPKEELGLIRVYWQAEQAHWFYEDYLRPLNPTLPSLSQRQFTHLILQSSPIYRSETFLRSLLGSTDDSGFGSESGKPLISSKGEILFDNVWEEYCAYKRMVPCCGGIMINAEGDKCLMVRGWKSNAGWSFPRGKINSEESEISCAVREVEEETGFDLTGLINPKEFVQTQISAQTITMFIVGGIDEDTVFETQTRKEIGAIEWVRLVDLPTWTNKKGPRNKHNNKRFYNVTPFVTPLKKWLVEHGYNPNAKSKKKRAPQPGQPQSPQYSQQYPTHQSSQSQAQAQFRNLQPYQFDTPTPSGDSPIQPSPTPIPHRDPSALDNLFSRFIHKQEEELSAVPSAPAQRLQKKNTVKTASEGDGLTRLFGNLDIVPIASSRPSGPRERQISQAETEKEEDDALARLLGGIGVVSSPVMSPAPAPAIVHKAEGREGKLLGILNSTPVFSSQNLQKPNSQTQQDTQIPPPPIKPHQTHLLSMLSSPQPKAASVTTQSSAHLTTKPVSLPTSPHPPSPTVEERRNKQRALLETLAGIGGLEIRRGSLPESGGGIPTNPLGMGHVPPPTPGSAQRGTSNPSPPRQPPPSYSAATSASSITSIPNQRGYNEHPLPPLPPTHHIQQTTEHQRSLLGALYSSQPVHQSSIPPQVNQNQIRQSQASIHGSIGSQQPQYGTSYRPPYQPPHPHVPGPNGFPIGGYGVNQPPPIVGPVQGQPQYGHNANIGPMGHNFLPQGGGIPHPPGSYAGQIPIGQTGVGNYQPAQPQGYQPPHPLGSGHLPLNTGYQPNLPTTRPPPGGQTYNPHPQYPSHPNATNNAALQSVNPNMGGQFTFPPNMNITPHQAGQQVSPNKGYQAVLSGTIGGGSVSAAGRNEMRSERESGVYHPVPRPPVGTALGLINQR